MGGAYLLLAMMILLVDETILETGLDEAYQSFNHSAATFLQVAVSNRVRVQWLNNSEVEICGLDVFTPTFLRLLMLSYAPCRPMPGWTARARPASWC